jgi:hypothetical protein
MGSLHEEWDPEKNANREMGVSRKDSARALLDGLAGDLIEGEELAWHVMEIFPEVHLILAVGNRLAYELYLIYYTEGQMRHKLGRGGIPVRESESGFERSSERAFVAKGRRSQE